MGSLKDEMIEQQNQFRDEKIAKYIGITYDEYCELETRLEGNESNDGLVYNYILYLDGEIPSRIMKKIKGLENGNWVNIPTNLIDSE